MGVVQNEHACVFMCVCLCILLVTCMCVNKCVLCLECDEGLEHRL